MAKPKYHPDFVRVLRDYPTQWDLHHDVEVRRINARLYADTPESRLARAQFEKNTPDPRQRGALIMGLVDRNTDQMMQTELHRAALKYDVKEISPAMVKEAFAEDHMNNSSVTPHIRALAAANNPPWDADKAWETVDVPRKVGEDFAKIQPHMFPTPPEPDMPPLVQPTHSRPQPVVQQAPQPMDVQQGSSFTGQDGAPAPAAQEQGGQGGVATNQTGGGMYAPGTEAP